MADPKIGIKFTPDLLGDFFKSIRDLRCVEGIPSTHTLRTYGYDKGADEFFMIWQSHDCPEGTPVVWITPLIQVAPHEIDPYWADRTEAEEHNCKCSQADGPCIHRRAKSG